MNIASTTNVSWLRNMKIGKSYVRYFDTHEKLHSAQSSIYKFNHGVGNAREVFLHTRTKVLADTSPGKMIYQLTVSCTSNLKKSLSDECTFTW